MNKGSIIYKDCKVYIYAPCDVFYGSFYIQGLKDYFGSRNVHFNLSKFPRFNPDVFAVIVEDKNGLQKKMVIDFLDSSQTNIDSLNWCDVYGKINLKENMPDGANKIIPIGPGFAIRIWNLPQTIFLALRNYFRSYRILPGYKKFFANYRDQYLRLPLTAYKPQPSEKNYVFVLNSIWKKSPFTNKNRLKFIEACKSIEGLEFEGGFAPRQNKDIQDFDAHTTSSRYSPQEYLLKTKRSSLVYNTPAVLDCHGWKLGEFLALGKAIISTPLSRAMPEPFTDQKHFYELNNETDCKTVIKKVLDDHILKQTLEKNAIDYYTQNLSPYQVIARLLNKHL